MANVLVARARWLLFRRWFELARRWFRPNRVKWEFTAQDMTLSIDEYSEKYIRPAMEALSTKFPDEIT